MQEIELLNGGAAKVDDEWYERLASIPWRRVRRGYARCGSIYMHRLICGLPILPEPRVCVHHRNGDKLDNRRSNLYVCTPAEHMELHHRPSTEA